MSDKMIRRRFTLEQKRDMIIQFRRLQDKGFTVAQCHSKLGLPNNTIYTWQSKMRKQGSSRSVEKEISLTKAQVISRFKQIHTLSDAIGLNLDQEQTIEAVFKLAANDAHA